MPRSSRHKSSKHSSREARDYSDSEKDSGLKEKKGREDGGSSTGSRHLKESASGEKRKLESKSIDVAKESTVTANAEYIGEYGSSSSSKKRKEKADDDRWTGGDNNEHELAKSEIKEMKSSSDSKRPSRRDENVTWGFDGEEGKKSGSKTEPKHHRSDRKERSDKEGGNERERKSNKRERFGDGVLGAEDNVSEVNKKQGSSGEERGAKHAVGNSGVKIQDDSQNLESERELDQQGRRKKDGSGDGDKRHGGIQGLVDGRLSSKDDISKSGRYKDGGHKDERVRDKYWEDAEKDNPHMDEKQRDNWPSRDYSFGRSDEKQVRDENKDLDVSHKKYKPYHSEYDYDRDRERNRDHDRDRNKDRDRDRGRSRQDPDRERDKDHDDRDNPLDRDRDRDRDFERAHDRERDRERGRDRYHHERDKDRIRDRDHNHDRSRDRDHDYDYGSHVDDKSSKYKEDRGRRRSPDGYDEYHIDKDRYLSRKTHADGVTSSSRHRNSPSSRSYVVSDKCRDGTQDDIKCGDSLRNGASISEVFDKVPKHRSGEKRAKFDDNLIIELPERSPSTKASPAGLKERSPSSTSVDRRYRTGRRRSLDVDEAERRSSGSNDIRDVPINEDRQGRDYPPMESSFYHKSSQGNVSSHCPGPGPCGFRAGADSPFIGSLGDENRGHSGSRYRRSADPIAGRGPGNAWKGVPSWHSPLSNGFLPFPPGPPGPHHGGFPPMMSQFPPLIGVRPSLEMNHPGIPYHMPDADRFPGHMRPMGWPNMVDGSVPPHFHGWDANNGGALRDESSIYGSGARGRDMNADMWKPNGDVNMDVTFGSQKDARIVKASADEASSAQDASRPYHESSCLDDQGTSLKKNASSGLSSAKDFPMTPTKVATDKTPESCSVDDTANYLRTYLTKLDISIDMSDPELYNRCISIGVKGQTDCVEEDLELDYLEENGVREPEITNLSMGPTYFPAAEDSIYERAMGLYKNQSTERTYAISNGEKLQSPPAEVSGLDVKQILVPNDQVGSCCNYSVQKEQPAVVVMSELPTAGEQEGKDHVPITSHDGFDGIQSLQRAEPAPDTGVKTDTLVLGVEKMGEDISAELLPKNADEVDLPVEGSLPDVTDSDAGVENGGSDAKKVGAGSPEQLDVSVSGSIILCHDCVNVCEDLSSVSSESESANLSRIHHAPESTH